VGSRIPAASQLPSQDLVRSGIVDSHHHLWDTAALDYALFQTVPALDRPYRASDYDGEAAPLGVEASICVEAASAGADGRRETEWLLAEVDRSSLVAGVVAWAPLDRPGELAPYLEWLLGLGGKPILGVRRSFELEPPEFPRLPELAAGVREAGDRGLVVDLVLYAPSLGATIELVDAGPQTRFVLDHLGKPRIREGVRDPWWAELRELALRPNVVCKLSGLPNEADRERWRVEDLQPYVDHALDCFGADRILYGSDWPVGNLAGGQGRWLATVQELLAGAGDAALAAIFGGNAQRHYALFG
jgi:L-fuconolactonase